MDPIDINSLKRVRVVSGLHEVKFLSSAYRYILSQVFNRSFHLLLGLDCSKTETLGMALHLSLEFKWLLTVREPSNLETLCLFPANIKLTRYSL